MKAYKVFDKNFKCREFQYEVGKTYELDGFLKICVNGFHACEKINDCFNYYSFDPENKIAQVELLGDIDKEGDKVATDKIKIIKEISWSDMLDLANTGRYNTGINNSGDWNSGYRNSGYRNSGYRNSGYSNSGDSNSGNWNSGDKNSGDWNSGYRNSGYSNSGNWNSGYSNSGDSNSGNWNSGDRNSGYWNSGYRNSGVFCNRGLKDTIIMFNKDSGINWYEWESSKAYAILSNLALCEWVYYSNMTDLEKQDNKNSYVTDGYLKEYSYKEACANLFNNMCDADKQEIKKLPNFDNDIFEDITGCRL